MKIELTIKIDGKEYTKDQARDIYNELKQIFDPKIIHYPGLLESPKYYEPPVNILPYGPIPTVTY